MLISTRLKWQSAQRLRREFPELAQRYWGMHIWDRSYFISTVGIDRDVIRKYVKDQVESHIREDQLKIWWDDNG